MSPLQRLGIMLVEARTKRPLARSSSEDSAAYKEKITLAHKDAIKDSAPGSSIIGIFTVGQKKAFMTIWYHPGLGLGSITTHQNGESYSCYMNRDKRPPYDDYASSFVDRFRPAKGVRRAAIQTRRAIRLGRFRRAFRSQLDSETGELRILRGPSESLEEKVKLSEFLLGHFSDKENVTLAHLDRFKKVQKSL